MAENKPNSHAVTPSEFAAPEDAKDLDFLWVDPGLGDGITTTNFHTVPVDKPKNFFRTHPDPAYRRRTEIYTHKVEGVIGEQHYIVAPAMRGRSKRRGRARSYRRLPRRYAALWPIKFPRTASTTTKLDVARVGSQGGMDGWVKLVWVTRSYQTRKPSPATLPIPTGEAPAVRRTGEARLRCARDHPR